MMHERDSHVALTLARTVQSFVSKGTSVEAGLSFERALHTDLLAAANWRLISGPDELDMGGFLRSRTGIHYEFDSILLAPDTLYIIEAKRHARITRQHVSEFVSKLLDVTLGSADQLVGLRIMPIFVSGLTTIDAAAWSYAISWGVLLIAPSHPTPWELVASLNAIAGVRREAARRLISDCVEACSQLWRPFNAIIRASDDLNARFDLFADGIYNAERVKNVLEFWGECQRAVVAFSNA